MDQQREESTANLSKLFARQTIRVLGDGENAELDGKNKKDMGDIVNQFTNMRIRQRVHKAKTNKEFDEEINKWKMEKIKSLGGLIISRNIYRGVEQIQAVLRFILQKPPKNLAPSAPFDSFRTIHIMKQGKGARGRGQEDQQRTRTLLETRISTLRKIKEKIQQSKQEFKTYSKKCRTTLKDLSDIKKTLDFDYVENGNFLRTNVKPVQGANKKDKYVNVFYRASKNFPNRSFYRNLVKINITPQDELEYEFSALDEEKLRDVYDKTFSISLTLKKKGQKKSLTSLQLGVLKIKFSEVEFKMLNMQLFNYLLQIISFGKIVPFEFKHSRTDIEIDCKHNLGLELAYRKKDEIKSSDRDSNNYLIWLMTLWLVNNSSYNNVRVNIQEMFGFLGNYMRLKKKLNKWKEYFPGFFYIEELNPKNFEVLIEAFFHYNKEISFNVSKRISTALKKLFIIIRGSKLYMINASTGYLNEITMEQLIEEEFKNKFWIHLSHPNVLSKKRK